MTYLDANATTMLDPLVLEAMMPYLTDHYANAASVHSFGHRLMHRLDEARDRVAALIGADTKDDITFTSGGTESNNAIIRSAASAFPDRRHIVTSAVEHSSVGRVILELELDGYEITRIPVDRDGCFDLNAFDAALRPDTALVSLMWANNETGVLFPIEEIGRRTREKGILFHTDAVQAVGKIPVDVGRASVDYLSVSAHKLYGPKGVGALYARRGVPFTPLLYGGAQQRGRRPGTENVAGIVGLGAASRLAQTLLDDGEASRHMAGLRDRLEDGLMQAIGDVHVVGRTAPRIPNTSNILFQGVEGEALLQLMSDRAIFASSGSACTAGTTEPSHVLLAMGYSERDALCAVRFSLSKFSTQDDIDVTIHTVPELVARLRTLVHAD